MSSGKPLASISALWWQPGLPDEHSVSPVAPYVRQRHRLVVKQQVRGLSKASAHQSAAPAGGQHYRATAERACGDTRLSFEISVVEPSKGNAHWQFADPRPKASQHITIRVAAPNAMRR
jgi:hypothetical protein